ITFRILHVAMTRFGIPVPACADIAVLVKGAYLARSKIVQFTMGLEDEYERNVREAQRMAENSRPITTVPRGCGSRSNGCGCLWHFAGTKRRKKINRVGLSSLMMTQRLRTRLCSEAEDGLVTIS
ncbi:MAG TPA: hypothetical protein VFI94_15960, partial [Pseudolabrys sp.]|nr:hypothetical protein [Pseudolabrys sp.]